VTLPSPASGGSSAAESVVLDDGTVQVVPEYPVRSTDPPSPAFRKQLRRSPRHGRTRLSAIAFCHSISYAAIRSATTIVGARVVRDDPV
jgi:hypothetical protein